LIAPTRRSGHFVVRRQTGRVAPHPDPFPPSVQYIERARLSPRAPLAWRLRVPCLRDEEGVQPVDDTERIARMCDGLRRYLDAHPGAADSLVGIRQWWLPPAFRNVALDELQQALARLVEAGEIRRSTLPDGSELFTRTGPPQGGRPGSSTTEARRSWRKK
jgi:hypothetical protein